MGALDIALIVILSYFLIRGIFRGLVKEVVGILGLFVAFWAASVYWQAGAEQLTPLTDNETYRGVLSFIVIYLVIYFLIGLLSIFVDKIVKMTITPLASGLAGAGLGLLKGSALCIILLTATTSFIRADQTFYLDSKVWPEISPFCEQVKGMVPDRLRRLMLITDQMLVQDLRSDPLPITNVAVTLVPPTDYFTLKKILDENSHFLSEAWKQKLTSISGPEAVDQELLTRFVRENPTLFSVPVNNQALNQGVSQSTSPSRPTWPIPAGE